MADTWVISLQKNKWISLVSKQYRIKCVLILVDRVVDSRSLEHWHCSLYLITGYQLGAVLREIILIDALLKGWTLSGTTCPGEMWLSGVRYIKQLGLWAIHLSLKSFMQILKHQHNLENYDNIVKVSYISYQEAWRGGCPCLEQKNLFRWK